jgi:ABC-2 type transport system ATP-binding protein
MVCGGVIIINKGSIVAQGPIDSLVEQFFPVSRVQVEVAAPPVAARDALRNLPGVLDVRDVLTGDGAATFAVEAARDRDVRGEIFQLATERRWPLLELRRVGMTLEEVFIRIVAGEEAEAVADAAAPGGDEEATA